MGVKFTAPEMYLPIEEARYGDTVCLDPNLLVVKNDTRWLFITRNGDVLKLMIVNGYVWSGQIITMPWAQEFVVVRP